MLLFVWNYINLDYSNLAQLTETKSRRIIDCPEMAIFPIFSEFGRKITDFDIQNEFGRSLMLPNIW